MSGNIEHDVFLSYNNRDQVAVEIIARKLMGHGLRVFLDRWYLVAGRPWPEHLESVLSRCRAAAVLIGPQGLGRWQQREQYLALDRQARDSSFPVIPVLLPASDPALGFLSLNTWVDLRRGLDNAEALRILTEAIQGRPPGPDARLGTATARFSICPYRGLHFFREEDAEFFFGRDAFIERLAAYVERHPLVAVVGASGSGKSSVVRAGLVPRLRRANGSHVWDFVTMVPGDRPLHSLAAVMVRLLETQGSDVDRLREVRKLADSFAERQLALRDVVSEALEKQNGTDRLMLIVDQWEELYTSTRDEVSRLRFIEEILDATAAGRLSVVLTMRGDFFGDALAYRPLSDALQDAIVNISRMTREELSAVIERPAEKVGLRFEPGLASRILEQVEREPGNLPLLEFVLAELWKERQEELLTHAAYEKIGGLHGAIATHAESAFAALSEADQEIARRIFLQLVRPAAHGGDAAHDAEAGPTRRRTSFAELGEKDLPVVRKLADDHLLVTGRNDASGEEFIDLVHEALIEAWSRLRLWIEEDREFLEWREQLRTLLGIAAAEKFDKDSLLRGPRLTEAQGWLAKRGDDLSSSEKAYIQASIDEVAAQAALLARNRIMERRFMIAGLLSVLVIAAAFFIYKTRQAKERRIELPPDAISVQPPQREKGVKELEESLKPLPTGTLPEKPEIRQASLATIRQLVGVTSLEMSGTPTIAVIGPPPSGKLLPRSQFEVIELPLGIEERSDFGMPDYVSSIVQCVLLTAPRTRFVFIAVRFDANFASDLERGLHRLTDEKPTKPALLLSTYSYTDKNAQRNVFNSITAMGISVVLSARNTNDPDDQKPLGNQFMTVGATSLTGTRSRFSGADPGLFWSPGEDLPLTSKGKPTLYSGTGPAAAVAAGVAVRVLDRHPRLEPAELLDVLRSTSRSRAPNGPPIVNLDAALARLK